MISGFYGFIPYDVRHHPDLKSSTKVLYAEITACLEKDGVCIKTNAYFSNVLGVGKTTISNCLTELRKYGFINVKIELQEKTQKFIKRYISLTPTNSLGGVNDNSQDPHTSNLGGVEEVASLKNDKTPSNTDQPLLLCNNIDIIYTNGIKKHTPLKKQINDEQLEVLKKLVFSFYEKQHSRFPDMYRGWQDDLNTVNGSINTLYNIIKRDGYKYEVIRDTLKWALNDGFWGKHLLTLKNLRVTSKNGFTLFQNLLHTRENN